MWMYHSHADEVADTYAGLMGPMEITRRGMARANGSPRDVGREVFALFSVMNENASPFLLENLHRFGRPPFPPHWHGNTATVNGMRMDTISLLPASTVVTDMVPDDPGIWLFHCHVNDHIRAGMLTRYEVTS